MSEVLVVGSTGGREHALGLALAEGGNRITYTHGGNAATYAESIDLKDAAEIADYASETGVDFAIVGPEMPLVQGQADLLRARGIPTFGPGADGARLEASKAFTSEICREAGILQPDTYVARDVESALGYVKHKPAEGYVIKADGLAAGKGVVLPKNKKKAREVVRGMMSGKLFGDEGKTIVFQERLDASGPEVSALFVIDGKDYTLLPLSQDHKRLKKGDKGPNTGGMGAYTPVPFESPELVGDLLDIGDRLVSTLRKRGIDYKGVAYVGAMRDIRRGSKPSVLEINVRFGDPETQVVMAALGSLGVRAFDLLDEAANGSLDPSLRGTYIGNELNNAALTVCLAAEGYPNSPKKGVEIHGLRRDYEGVTVHHAGTKYDSELEQVVVNGGRVLYLTATGKDAEQAKSKVYAAIGPDGVHFDGMQYRTDIAWQARS